MARSFVVAFARAVSNSSTQGVALYGITRSTAQTRVGPPQLAAGMLARVRSKMGVWSAPSWTIRVSAKSAAVSLAHANPNLLIQVIALFGGFRAAAWLKSGPQLSANLLGQLRSKASGAMGLPSLPLHIRAAVWMRSWAGAAAQQSGGLGARITARVRGVSHPTLAVSVAGTNHTRGAVTGWLYLGAPLRAILQMNITLGAAFARIISPSARLGEAVRGGARSFAASSLSGYGRLAMWLRPRLRYPIRVTGVSRIRFAETGTPRLQLTITKVRVTSQVSGGAGIRGLTRLGGRTLSLIRGRERPALTVGLFGRSEAQTLARTRWRLAARLLGRARSGAAASGSFLGKTALTAAARLAQFSSIKPRLALRNLAGSLASRVAGRTRNVASLLSGVSRLRSGFRGQAYLFKLGQLAQGFSFFGPHRRRTISMVNGAVTLSACLDLLPPIDAGVEREWVTFDYGRVLVAGVTIVSATVTCVVESGSGTDLTPGARLVGSPVVIASPRTGATRAAIAQLVGNCQADVVYQFQCVAATTDGQLLSLWGRLSCIAPE
jgi:hypothetical protein